MKIRELYNQAFSGATLMSPSESSDRWAMFGQLVYEEFLLAEDMAKDKKIEAQNDCMLLVSLLDNKQKERVLKLYNKGFIEKYLKK